MQAQIVIRKMSELIEAPECADSTTAETMAPGGDDNTKWAPPAGADGNGNPGGTESESGTEVGDGGMTGASPAPRRDLGVTETGWGHDEGWIGPSGSEV